MTDANVLIGEARRVAGDLERLLVRMDEQVDTVVRGIVAATGAVESVVLVGDGDSYAASLAAERSFESVTGVACRALPAERFVDYPPVDLEGALVVATSASGRTPRSVDALAVAHAMGATTVGVTGNGASPLATAAKHPLVVDVVDPQPSPGFRTYQASLLGLVRLAVGLGGPGPDAAAWIGELETLPQAVAETAAAAEAQAAEVADVLSPAGEAPAAVAVVGTGPAFGTATFVAAKLVEVAGLVAFAQDLEEWWHVERFAHPPDMPMVVIAPPGPSHPRAVSLAEAAGGLGRRVAAVAHAGDTTMAAAARAVLHVHAPAWLRDELSPLVDYVVGGALASAVAERLGRRPFGGGAPGFR